MAHKDNIGIEYEGKTLVKCPQTASCEVYIPDGIEKIADRAFEECLLITSVSLPATLNEIGILAFNKCVNLSNITLRGDVSPSIPTPPNAPFTDCDNLTQLTINGDLTFPNDILQSISTLTTIAVSEQNPYFIVKNGLLCQGTGTELIFCPRGASGTIAVPDDVKKIKNSAFAICTKITEISLPASVNEIGESAFFCCGDLQKINIPEGIKKIPCCAFLNCFSLTEIAIPASVTIIDGMAFDGCTSLKQINFSKGVNSIEEFAFRNCISLTSISLPHGVTKIGKSAFDSLRSLKKVQLPNTLKTVEESSFTKCRKITTVTFDGSLEEWCSINFENATANPLHSKAALYINNKLLTCAEIPLGVSEIHYQFSGCSSLKCVTIHDLVVSIGDFAFSQCENLSSIRVGDGVQHIGHGAFAYCKKLKSLFLPGFLTSVGSKIAVDVEDITIYCESEPQEGWSEKWNDKNVKTEEKHDFTTRTPRNWYERFVAKST